MTGPAPGEAADGRRLGGGRRGCGPGRDAHASSSAAHARADARPRAGALAGRWGPEIPLLGELRVARFDTIRTGPGRDGNLAPWQKPRTPGSAACRCRRGCRAWAHAGRSRRRGGADVGGAGRVGVAGAATAPGRWDGSLMPGPARSSNGTLYPGSGRRGHDEGPRGRTHRGRADRDARMAERRAEVQTPWSRTPWACPTEELREGDRLRQVRLREVAGENADEAAAGSCDGGQGPRRGGRRGRHPTRPRPTSGLAAIMRARSMPGSPGTTPPWRAVAWASVRSMGRGGHGPGGMGGPGMGRMGHHRGGWDADGVEPGTTEPTPGTSGTSTTILVGVTSHTAPRGPGRARAARGVSPSLSTWLWTTRPSSIARHERAIARARSGRRRRRRTRAWRPRTTCPTPGRRRSRGGCPLRACARASVHPQAAP